MGSVLWHVRELSHREQSGREPPQDSDFIHSDLQPAGTPSLYPEGQLGGLHLLPSLGHSSGQFFIQQAVLLHGTLQSQEHLPQALPPDRYPDAHVAEHVPVAPQEPPLHVTPSGMVPQPVHVAPETGVEPLIKTINAKPIIKRPTEATVEKVLLNECLVVIIYSSVRIRTYIILAISEEIPTDSRMHSPSVLYFTK